MMAELRAFDIPVLIIDDASSDDTSQVVRDAQKEHSGITYERNSENLGMYLNSLSVIERSFTKYVWFMGDDDAVIEGGVSSVLDRIKNEYDYVVVNSTGLDPTLTIVKKRKIIDCDSDYNYSVGSHGRLLEDMSTWGYHGFMSSMIIRRDLLIRHIPDFKNTANPMFNNNWLPLMIFYSSIVNGNGYFICEPVIKNRSDNRYLKTFFWDKSLLGRVKALEALVQHGYERNTVRKAVDINLVDAIFFSLQAKRTNPDVRLLNSYVKQTFMLNLGFKLVAFIIDHTPRFLLSYAGTVLDQFRS